MQDAPSATPDSGSPVEHGVRVPGESESGSPALSLSPGYRTTEFWLALAVVLCVFAEALAGMLPAGHAAVVAVITAAIYKALRTFLKFRAAQFSSDVLLAQIESQANRATVIEPPAPSRALAEFRAAPVKDLGGFAQPRSLAALALTGCSVLAALLYLTGCAQLGAYDRTYSLSYTSGDGQQIGTSITLRPASGGFAK